MFSLTLHRPRPRWRATLLASAASLLASIAAAAPWLPDSDERVIERVPARDDAQLAELAALRAARRPGSAQETERALDFAARALELGMARGDPRLIGQAEAALAPLLARDAVPPRAHTLHAAVLQNRHAFEPALAELERALAEHPDDAQAWLTRAVVQVVQGEPAAARASCARLLGRTSALVVTSCAALAAGRSGSARASYDALERALGRAPGASAGEQRFARLELADLARRLGRDAAAEPWLRGAVESEPEAVAPRLALADLLLDGGRAREVRELLAGPRPDTLALLRLALAERALGAAAIAAEHSTALEARFAEARLRGAALHEREEARFQLELRGDAPGALALAQSNFEIQREPEDARLLCTAALAAGEPGAAAPARAFRERTGLEDARLDALLARLEESAR